MYKVTKVFGKDTEFRERLPPLKIVWRNLSLKVSESRHYTKIFEVRINKNFQNLFS
jgi:hypothetical protein